LGLLNGSEIWEIAMASSTSMSELSGLRTWIAAATADGAGDEDAVSVGDFRMDFAARRATVRGQELRLTGEEFEMLVFLIGHPRSVITPRTRLSTRWGGGLVRQADFLRVFGQLRKKLESMEGCSHYLRTEPWVVYKFDPCNRVGES
jgi:DNA-binding response OmpR family regulator